MRFSIATLLGLVFLSALGLAALRDINAYSGVVLFMGTLSVLSSALYIWAVAALTRRLGRALRGRDDLPDLPPRM